jgi:hypothetical protein
VSELSEQTLDTAADDKSLKTQATSSSKGSNSSSGSRRRLHRIRQFFSLKKNDLDYEKLEEKKPKKTVKKHEETSWDQYYAGMQYGCWF